MTDSATFLFTFFLALVLATIGTAAASLFGALPVYPFLTLGAISLAVGIYGKFFVWGAPDSPMPQCPSCRGANITSCPGGTCYKPSEWARQNTKYICKDCLCEFGEFGDPDAEVFVLAGKKGGGLDLPASCDARLVLQSLKPSLVECSNTLCRDLNGDRRMWISGLDDALEPGVCPWCGTKQVS